MPEFVVIATWAFGETAVKAAAPLLAAGKPALDAVIAGAQAVEDDPPGEYTSINCCPLCTINGHCPPGCDNSNPPTLDGISPSSGFLGDNTIPMTFTGGFNGVPPQPKVGGATGITVSAINEDAAADTITANFSIPATASTGNRSVSVSDGGGASNSLTFTVKARTATVTIQFTGQKTTGDNLKFSNASQQTCSESLGLHNCSSIGTWVWNVEVQANVSDDAANWTFAQSYTGRKKGFTKDSSGNLVPFDITLNVPNDGPGSNFVQQPAGQKVMFFIDAPGHTYKLDNGQPIDSITQVENFTIQTCNTIQSSVCTTTNWYLKLVVNPGARLDTTNSVAALGSTSTNF